MYYIANANVLYFWYDSHPKKKAQGIKNSQRTKCKDIFQNVQGQPNFHSKLWGRIFVPGKYKLWWPPKSKINVIETYVNNFL